MTPYIIAIGALACALAWARKRDQFAGDQTVTDKKTHGSTLRHTTEKQNTQKEDDIS